MDQVKSFKQLRQEKNITQAQLSEMTGLSKAIISKYENGLTKPRGKNLIEIAEAFNVSVEELSTSLGVVEAKVDDFIDLPLVGAEPNRRIFIARSELNRFNCNEEDLRAFVYKSDLMSPLIYFGDIVIVDKSKKRPSDGSIIALTPIDKTLILRKVSLKADGDILLSVLDPSVPVETSKLESINIYGRVVLRQGIL